MIQKKNDRENWNGDAYSNASLTFTSTSPRNVRKMEIPRHMMRKTKSGKQTARNSSMNLMSHKNIGTSVHTGFSAGLTCFGWQDYKRDKGQLIPFPDQTGDQTFHGKEQLCSTSSTGFKFYIKSWPLEQLESKIYSSHSLPKNPTPANYDWRMRKSKKWWASFHLGCLFIYKKSRKYNNSPLHKGPSHPRARWIFPQQGSAYA